MLKDNLAVLRNLMGASQEEIADKLGVSRQAYARWETGAVVPDVDKCSRLAELFGVSLDSLVKAPQEDGLGVLPPVPRGKNIWGSVTLGDRGQIVIPKAVREKFRLTDGQRLIVLSDEEGIALVPAETFEAKIRSIMDLATVKNDG